MLCSLLHLVKPTLSLETSSREQSGLLGKLYRCEKSWCCGKAALEFSMWRSAVKSKQLTLSALLSSPASGPERLRTLHRKEQAEVSYIPVTVQQAAQQTASEEPGTDAREKRSVPNWALTSSDFFGWLEYLRTHAGYNKMEDLARTFWAHFPSANHLGYETSEPEE
ncbi:otospiralin-like [Arapaima gigas]